MGHQGMHIETIEILTSGFEPDVSHDFSGPARVCCSLLDARAALFHASEAIQRVGDVRMRGPRLALEHAKRFCREFAGAFERFLLQRGQSLGVKSYRSFNRSSVLSHRQIVPQQQWSPPYSSINA